MIFFSINVFFFNFLISKNVVCYAPNLNYYDISQMSIEIEHLNSSRSKLIVIPRNNYATGLTLMASYLIGVKADKLFLDLHKIDMTKDDNSKRVRCICIIYSNNNVFYIIFIFIFISSSQRYLSAIIIEEERTYIVLPLQQV